jgi:signal transduction histidine kinase/DNA-binding response OmpR family regulator
MPLKSDTTHLAIDRIAKRACILFGAVLLGCAVVDLLLLVPNRGDWGDTPFHVVTAVVMLGIGGASLQVYRYWQSLLRARAADSATIARLDKACATAEAANLAKSRYLSTVSHEIRSPLNAIYGYAQLVGRNEGAGAIEAAAVIRRCAEHITSLVEALLDIAQVENGVLRIKVEPVHLEQFIDQIIRMVRPSATAKRLDFVYEAKGRLPAMVRMDQNRLRQVLLNLLSNAVKYTDTGAVTLTVRYAAQIAIFEVRDTGPGIRVEDQAAIFEPFERGGDDAQRARPGAGLGLSIARAVVDILGGQLELAESSPAGTCFRVSVMLGEVTSQYRQPVARRQVTGYLGPRRKVLLVDDDAEQRQFLSELLGSLGFEVEAVGDGETAVALVDMGASTGATASPAFDLAILDITMPGISGWETAARLRERMGEDISILMLSANAQEFHRPETREPTHDHFLVKPVEFNQLIETVGGLLDLAWALAPDVPKAAVAASAVDMPDNPAPSTLDADGRAHTVRIRELLRIGYVRGIEQEIRQLAEHPATAPLADKLFACLDRFDLPGMSRIVEES